jgi:hypothetical protein
LQFTRKEGSCDGYGQMNEPPGNRLRVGLTGLTMAEYFRDEKQAGGKGRDHRLSDDRGPIRTPGSGG